MLSTSSDFIQLIGMLLCSHTILTEKKTPKKLVKFVLFVDEKLLCTIE